MKTREAELLGTIFRYLAECIDDGDARIVRECGLTADDIEAIAGLTLAELRHLSTMRGHCIKIEIDAEALRSLHRHILHERERLQLRRSLLIADAPQPLMEHLFALGKNDYDNERKCAGVLAHKPGRCGRPTDAICKRVYLELKGLGHLRLQTLAPHEWLRISTASGASLRELWALHHDETTMDQPEAITPKAPRPSQVAQPVPPPDPAPRPSQVVPVVPPPDPAPAATTPSCRANGATQVSRIPVNADAIPIAQNYVE